MSGILFIYYIRFYFEYHFTGVTLGDSLANGFNYELPQWANGISHYHGVNIFDFVVTWFEYLPWFVLLILETTFGLFARKSSEQ